MNYLLVLYRNVGVKINVTKCLVKCKPKIHVCEVRIRVCVWVMY